MNTTFSLRLLEKEGVAARDVAMECFYQLDQLEAQLSRFIEGSDVSRINAMSAGQTLYVSDACHRCLILAMDASVRTHGLFDITQGARIEHKKSSLPGEAPKLEGRLMVHPDVAAITCEEAGRQIDLGGIGKGFALDELRKLLDEWDVGDALLSAGASSLLAHGDEGWPIELKGDQGELRMELRSQSMSASGTGIQGSHIIHPWGDGEMPQQPCKRLWVIADCAAEAEVWSTALMLIDAKDVPEATISCASSMQVYADRGADLIRLR